MKKITSLLLTLAMLATVFAAMPAYASSDVWGDAEVATAFAGGTGTDEDPYQIANAAQLRYMNELVNTGASYTDAESVTQYYYAASYKLTADIDLENTEWRPIGWALPLSWAMVDGKEVVTRTPEFKGSFDGNNHVIKNVKITNTGTANTVPTSKYMGFFGYAYDATIENLGLDNIDIQWANHDYLYDTTNNKKERNDYYGTFVGAAAYANISNCYVVNSTLKNTNSSINDSGFGGFIGALNFNNSISYCYVYNTEISASKNKTQSGFAGNCLSATNAVSNSYAAKIKVNREGTYATTYGFMWDERGLSTNTATNCYSTLCDAQGTNYASYGYSKLYDGAKSKGETGVTSEALIDAMLATGVYAQDPAINDGYPYLKVGFDGTPATSYDGGSGTEDDPYLISTPGQLLLASRQVNSGVARDSYFKLLNDIDYCNQPWEPIGYSNQGGSADFCGGFDGDNHIIRNLTLGSDNYYYCGFFGLLTGATIKDLGIDNFQLIRKNTVTSQIRVVGGFAGAARSSNAGKASKITNCYIKNSSVKQTTNFGSGSEAEGNRVNIDSSLGGFIGRVDIRNVPVELMNCYADNIILDAAVQGRACGFIGGVDFYNDANATGVKLTNCYASRITNADPAGTQMGFGFTNTGTSYAFDAEKVILSNCYSTFSTVLGTSGSAKKIENTFGTENASLRTIADAIESLNGWQNGALINDGYPALSWEVAPVAPDYTIKAVNREIMTMNVSGSSGSYNCNLTSGYKVTVDISRKPGVTDVANVYVAGYDMDGRLTGAQKATVDKDDFSFTADVNGKEAKMVKVFLWDDEFDAIVDPYVADTSIYAPLDEVWSCTGASGGEGGGTAVPTKKTRLVLMGDSIMDSVWNTTDYSWNKYGWEAYIGQYLTDNMTVIKHGHSGQTVKMFIDGRSTYHVCSWDSIKTQFSAGDYVVLALGSNDHNAITNGTFTVEEYKDWYRQIIRETRAKGATIILSTPKVAAATYNSTTGKFDPESQAPKARKAAIEVANEMGVDYVDMATVYADALNAMIKNKEYTYEEMAVQKDGSTVIGPGLIYVDGTHLTEYGAQLFARLFAEQIEAKTTGLENFIEIQ